MPTRTITHTYLSTGYSLSPSYDTLIVTGSGTIGGSGVQANAAATIDNFGTIRSTGTAGQAIALYDGGSVTNGGTADTTALISGAVGITLSQAGAVTNFGTIESSGTGGALNSSASGTITNSGLILSTGTAGYALETGFVTNFGTIESSGTEAAVDSFGGGTVTNFGTILSTRTAGTAVECRSGTIRNFGRIVGAAYAGTLVNGSTAETGAYVDGIVFGTTILNYGTLLFADGYAITNGSARDTAAVMNGVAVGQSGTMSNFGTIRGGVGFDRNNLLVNGSLADRSALIDPEAERRYSELAPGALLNFGTVNALATYSGTGINVDKLTNGSAADTTALIESLRLVRTEDDGVLVNFGRIVGNTSNVGGGVSGQFVTNGTKTDTTALISGEVGVRAGKVSNFGTIWGWDGPGVDGGTLTNGSSGDTHALIHGGVSVAATVTNFGIIWGGVTSSPTVTNFGTIGAGVSLSSTITNFGTIEVAAGGTAVLLTDHTSLLTLEGGSVISGLVAGADGTLALAGGAGAGTITGLGTQFTELAVIDVDAGARWTLTGANAAPGLRLTDLGTLVNAGSLSGGVELQGGYFWNDASHVVSNGGYGIFGATGTADTVVNLGTVSSGGSAVDLAGGGRVTNGSAKATGALIEGKVGVVLGAAGTVATFGTIDGTGGTAIDFKGSSDDLVVEASAVFMGALAGFGKTDQIDLAGFAKTAAEHVAFQENAAKTEGTLTVTDGAQQRKIALLGQFSAAGFHLERDGHGGSLVTYAPPPAHPPALAPPAT